MRAFKTNAKTRIQFHWVYEGYGLERIGDREGLEIQWRECEDCEDEERRLMDEYKLRTGDIPPGNLRKERRPPLLETGVEEA